MNRGARFLFADSDGAVGGGAVRFGTDFRILESCCAVRCGADFRILGSCCAVRFGKKTVKPHRTVPAL